MTWEQIADKYLDKFGKYIDEFAAKLGTTSQYVFEILVKQQVTTGISWLVFFVILLVLSVIATIMFMKTYKRAVENHKYDLEYGCLIGMIVGCIVILVCLASISYDIRLIMNPEYYALQDILDFVKARIGE